MEQKVTEPVKAEVTAVSVEEFVERIKVKEQMVLVPEFGPGKGVRIQPITLDTRQKMRSVTRKPDGSINEDEFQVFTLVFGVIEPKLSHQQVVAIRTGNPSVVDRIAKAIWTASGMGLDGDAVKNA